jgi:PAS domain S-box-containing protein
VTIPDVVTPAAGARALRFTAGTFGSAEAAAAGVLDAVRELLGVAAASAAVFDGGRYVVVGVAGMPGIGPRPGDVLSVAQIAPEGAVPDNSGDSSPLARPSRLTIPLSGSDGLPLGVICAFDPEPVRLAEADRERVAILARLLAGEFELDHERRTRLRLARHRATAAGLANRAMRREPPEQVLADGARLVADILHAERCEVLELLPDTHQVRPWPGVATTAIGVSRDPDAAEPGQPRQPGYPDAGRADAGPWTPWDPALVTATLAADRLVILPVADVAARAAAPGGAATDLTRDATATIALRSGDVVVGVLGAFGVARHSRGREYVNLVQSIANAMAAAVESHRWRQTSSWRSRLDQSLTEVSTQFIDLAPDQIDDGIVDALAAIGTTIGATSAAVHRLGPEGTDQHQPRLRRTHAWPAGGDDAATPTPAIEPGPLEWLRRGEVVHLECETSGEGPVLAVPFRADGDLLGFAAFAGPGVREPWPSSVYSSLRPLGDILAHAVARRRAAAEREESERRYRTLVDSIADVIVHIDGRGRLSYVNRAWTELTGVSGQDMVGRDPLDSVHPDDRPIASEHMQRALQGVEDEVREVRFVDAGGGIRWLEVKGRVLYDADGEADGFSGVLHDVTARREAEAEIRAAAESAERAREEAERARDAAVKASKAKSEFLSRMSHELRTPLNAILGFGQLLELGELGEEDAENVDQIMRAGRHLLDLINEVLDVVRVESGRLALSLEPVDVGRVVSESLDLVRPAVAARGIQVDAPGTQFRARALADRQRLKQVLVNLLSNAVKYNVPGGRIVVRCEALPPDAVTNGAAEAPHGRLRLTVADTGVGISPEHMDDIFTPFARLGAEGSDIEGAGLGLALTKTLVEALGGVIQLSSEVGRGTSVMVDVPAAEPVVADSPGAAPPDATTCTVLYVEDNESNVLLVRRVLARRPHIRLVVVGDGAEAVEVAHRVIPDLVLLDLHLPGLHGAGVLTALRGSDKEQVREAPIVILTADLTAGTERRMIDAGATLFLPKPIDVAHLLDVVDHHLPAPPTVRAATPQADPLG